MTTGWQKSFKASARYNRKVALEGNLQRAIIEGAVIRSDDIKHIASVYETSQKRVRQIFQQVEMEQAIFKAAREADDTLLDLLDKAIEQMSEEQATRLLDKVHQIQSEDLRDLRGWK